MKSEYQNRRNEEVIALCVDDESVLLDVLERTVRKSPDITETAAFDDEYDALAWAEKNPFDIAFLDIELHSIDGLSLARRLLELSPSASVVFCTGYRKYGVDVLQMHIDAGYLVKPVRASDVQREIDHIKMKKAEHKPEALIQAVCFGPFEIFAGKRPVTFKRRKTRELLAILIIRRGAVVSGNELCSILWEDSYMSEDRNRNYLYHLVSDMKNSLKAVGAEKVILDLDKGYAIDPHLISCDYYQFLDGDEQAVRSFTGEFMSRYSWAEETTAWLCRQTQV